MKKLLYCFFLFAPSIIQAQHKVTFIVHETLNAKEDTVFIAGTFNSWNYKADEKFKLKPSNGEKSITLDLKEGEFSYSYHRGSVDKTERGWYDVNEIKRAVIITGDTILNDTVVAWKDGATPRIDVLELTQSIINEHPEIQLRNMNMWRFREGNDSTWANEALNTDNWKELSIAEYKRISEYKNGRTEFWIKALIKTDSTLYNMPLHFGYGGWPAADLFINGELIQRYGDAGSGNVPFKENLTVHSNTIDILLSPEIEHVLAMHIVDEESGLQRTPKGIYGINILNNEKQAEVDKHIREEPIYFTIRIVVCTLLCLLFWLLVFLNPKEKSFKIVAAFLTVLMLINMAIWMPHNPLATFASIKITDLIFPVLNEIFKVLIILLLVIIFNRKVTTLLISILIFLLVLGLAVNYFHLSFLQGVSIIILIVLLAYYIVSSWRSLKGAQWIIIAGILLMIVLLIVPIVFDVFQSPSFTFVSIYITVLFLSFPLSLLVYVAFRFKEIIREVKQNANEVIKITEEKKELLASQNERLELQVTERTAELNQSLNHLQATQSQLIQSEKMASLGELTAGIAHEIQNPLNFVNNFSDVNKELLTEMNDEIEKGNLDEVKAIAKDVIDNEQKINHHGKRADAIVKGMLQHSRSSSGQKEPTDINALCDEYLRLSYHGLRAKDKSFNAKFETDFDSSLPKIDVVPQDIGRVVLNLINNAFYAVNEKEKQNISGYEPTVTVSTKNENGKVIISVKDNGNGIPDSIKEKIFQPFFTTKPTGQGTGLGLSLSYDIVKAHGGEMTVETIEGKGSTFIVQLPQTK